MDIARRDSSAPHQHGVWKDLWRHLRKKEQKRRARAREAAGAADRTNAVTHARCTLHENNIPCCYCATSLHTAAAHTHAGFMHTRTHTHTHTRWLRDDISPAALSMPVSEQTTDTPSSLIISNISQLLCCSSLWQFFHRISLVAAREGIIIPYIYFLTSRMLSLTPGFIYSLL